MSSMGINLAVEQGLCYAKSAILHAKCAKKRVDPAGILVQSHKYCPALPRLALARIRKKETFVLAGKVFLFRAQELSAGSFARGITDDLATGTNTDHFLRVTSADLYLLPPNV